MPGYPDSGFKPPGPDSTQALRNLREHHRDFLSWPECLLIREELENEIAPQLFPGILKALKKDVVQ